MYGWLRRRLSESASKRVGIANGSTGKAWHYNPVTLECSKFSIDKVPVGWLLGRKPKPICLGCSLETKTRYQKYCTDCRPSKEKTVVRKEKVKNFYSNEEKLEALLKCDGKIRQALFMLGLNDSGENYRMMKNINATVYPHATNVLKD